MECDRCKRHLHDTVHTREYYRVEAYRLHTGKTVPVVIRDENDEERKYLKIEAPRIITLCAECLKSEEVIEAVEKYEAPDGV